MSTRTLLATATTVVSGAAVVAAAVLLPTTAQADPTTAPGPAPKNVTICVNGPDGSAFMFNRVSAVSRDKGVYRLLSTTQTKSVAGGCGTVAVGSTGTVKLRAEHVSVRHLKKRICEKTTYRAQWPLMAAESVADGSTYTALLHKTGTRLARCAPKARPAA